MSPSRGTRASPGRERRRTAGPSLLSPVPSPRPPRTDTPPTLRSRASAAPAPAGAVRAAFLNVKDAAEHLGLSPHTLYVWRHRRQGPSSFRMGPRGRVMYRREAVDAWIREQEQADSRSNAVLSPLSATPQLRPSRIPNA
ncbi:helix-turn-helix domain-containing protein [Streptomyces sp. NPDC007861]|uniref:helix-turn-helix transcriptional regulator n=1 Tax=Streptomyces sp. NPDC007861 TaxID=3154893 RepID=UPI0033F648EA